MDPDPDPHQSNKQDPDPHQSYKQNPDPHQNYADPQHWTTGSRQILNIANRNLVWSDCLTLFGLAECW
jgi:hypothetical protein